MSDLPLFDGATFNPERDGDRLTGNLLKTFRVMSDFQWHTLAELKERVGCSEAGVSARLRDLRKEKFGAHKIESECVSGGLWRYRLVPAAERAAS